ncbi:MAG: phosphatase PAP2 family protein [Paludibacteraceae bacterium]|nr:phosphatase PAP2 family protein [Paludibacteraceae bacterium]
MLKSEKYFLIPFVAVWTFGLVLWAITDKIGFHLVLNAFHTPIFDTFFKYFTYVGAWVPCAVAVVLLIFRKWKIASVILVGQLVATLITTPLKHIIRAKRPSAILSDLGINFPVVEGVDLHSTLSFPSGHTSAAFAFCFAVALFCPRWWQKLLCLFVAVLCGYSRIYLSQHFLEDVLAGSMVGVVSILVLIPLSKKLRVL